MVKNGKNILRLMAVLALFGSLCGCAVLKPQISDGPGMEYRDSDYRTEYANVLDFPSQRDAPYYAVVFLGYGDDLYEFRDAYVKDFFAELSEEAIQKVAHIDWEGDEWYLVIPRYRELVCVKNLDTDETYMAYTGEAFTVKCNPFDADSNIEISCDGMYGFSPQIGGNGMLVPSEVAWDVTDYTAIKEN